MFWVLVSVLLAKKYEDAISKVAAILITKKTPMFVLTMPAIKRV